jgi:predicted nucleic acid-binding protein
VRLFLDTSVLLAACGSTRGASRAIFNRAQAQDWLLIATPYVLKEVRRNLGDLPTGAEAVWERLRPQLLLLDDVVTLDQVAVFPIAKDRPVLFSALAWANVLLTRDTGDFMRLLGQSFYGLAVLTPGNFLERERSAGRLRETSNE